MLDFETKVCSAILRMERC